MDEPYFTIRLKSSTVMKLKKLWQHHDDTYDAVINKLLEGKK